MFLEKENYYEVEEFKKLGIKAIYTKQTAGNMAYYVLNEEGKVRKNREKIIKELNLEGKKIVYARQTHSTNVKILKEETEIFYDDIDAFITQKKDIVIFIQYADCLPIFYFDKKNNVIALAHSGWKGSFFGIQKKVLDMMKKEFNSNLEDILIALGIGISLEAYEVGDDFYQNFKENFNKEFIEKSFKKINDKWHFDNEIFNFELLKAYGIKEENIIKSNICNMNSGKFFSYRKEKEKSGRNAGIISFILE